jgi:hypothetical protein
LTAAGHHVQANVHTRSAQQFSLPKGAGPCIASVRTQLVVGLDLTRGQLCAGEITMATTVGKFSLWSIAILIAIVIVALMLAAR